MPGESVEKVASGDYLYTGRHGWPMVYGIRACAGSVLFPDTLYLRVLRRLRRSLPVLLDSSASVGRVVTFAGLEVGVAG